MTDVPSIEMEPTKRPVWVRERRSVYCRWSAAAFGEFALLVALISAAVHFSGSSSPTLVVWLLAVAYFLVASLGLAVMLSGLSSVRLSRFVRAVEVPESAVGSRYRRGAAS